MATQNIEVGTQKEVEPYSAAKDSTDDFTAEDFVCKNAMVLDHVSIQKPSTTILTVSIVYPGTDGATTVLQIFPSGVTTGICGEVEKLSLPTFTIIRFDSTGAVSGDKKVTIVVKRVDA